METTYRCIYCGGITGVSIEEAQKARGHGPGKCVNACQYCREGVPHTANACANAPDEARTHPYRRYEEP